MFTVEKWTKQGESLVQENVRSFFIDKISRMDWKTTTYATRIIGKNEVKKMAASVGLKTVNMVSVNQKFMFADLVGLKSITDRNIIEVFFAIVSGIAIPVLIRKVDVVSTEKTN